jgi:hypothetical protein
MPTNEMRNTYIHINKYRYKTFVGRLWINTEDNLFFKTYDKTQYL